MGEAIMSRSFGVDIRIQPPVAVADYCSLLMVLRDPNGRPLKNWPVNCKDGESTYNYTTNDEGQALFMCNSGAANFSIPNSIGDGITYLDILPTTLDVDAPVATSNILNVRMDQPVSGSKVRYNSAGAYNFFLFNKTNVDLFIGAGGGGGGSVGGGAGGECAFYENITLSNYQNHAAYIGSGGSGISITGDSTNNTLTYNTTSGGSGGTTYIDNYSVIGGNGGNNSRGGISPNSGWFGNGWYSSFGSNKTKINSNVSNYGGGGGYGGATNIVYAHSGYVTGSNANGYKGSEAAALRNVNNVVQNNKFIGSPGGGYGVYAYSYKFAYKGTLSSSQPTPWWRLDGNAYFNTIISNGTDGLGGGGGALFYLNYEIFSNASIPMSRVGTRQVSGKGGSGTIEFTFRD